MVNFKFIFNKYKKKLFHSISKRIKLNDKGKGNSIEWGKRFYYDKVYVTFNGNNNHIFIGNDCRFMQTSHLYVQGDGNVIVIGNNVSFDQNVGILAADGTKVTIGDGCMFAEGVRIRTSDQHPIYDCDSNMVVNASKDVKIGNNVWLGAYVIINKGVTIKNDCVVGIGSIVTKDVDSNCIAVGIPARIIKNNIYWKNEE